jgi:phosphate transport system substrate-binding protein
MQFPLAYIIRKVGLATGLALAMLSSTGWAASITVVGSNTLEPFMRQWAEMMKEKSPATEVSISSPGTSVAPKALVQDAADLAAMNREMTNDELEAFIRAHGYYPTAIAVAIEAVALYVNPANPLNGIDYAQLDAIYSNSHGCGWREDIKNWGQLGLNEDWAKAPIKLLGHNNKSAVRDFFNKSVMCRDDFKTIMQELSHADLLEMVGQDRFALGYGRYQAGTKLKILPIKKGGGDYVPLTLENVYNRSYRLQHYMYLYVNKPKDKSISPAVLEFLKVGLSKQGQAYVSDAGYIPLSDELVQRQMNKLR